MATEKNATAELATIAAPDETALIAVTQLPIITERLRDVKTAVEATVEEAKSMVATADTIQAVKARRADLNKQFTELETQRKAVKAQIMEPYNRFEAVYKECISEPFRDADLSLKATVDEFEGAIKKRALDRLESYYRELCSMEGIDWLAFPQAMRMSGVKITLADCKTREPRKAMEALANFVSKIGLGLDQIRKMADSAEIMVEFRKTLDAGTAVATVQERKREMERTAAEEEARKEEEARRQEMIAKVRAYTPPTATPEAAPAPIGEDASFPPMIGFKIYFKTAAEYQTVRPILVQLRDTLKREGIQYGK